MFLCKPCIKNDKVKITAKDYALSKFLFGGYGISFGACESCSKVGECVDA